MRISKTPAISILLILFLILASLPLIAASSPLDSWRIGVKGAAQSSGISSSSMDKDITAFAVSSPPTKSIWGYSFGLMSDWNFSRVFSLHGELQYSKQGYTTTINLPTDGIGYKTLHLRNIEIPLLLRYKPTSHQSITPYLEAGLSYSIYTSGRVEYDNYAIQRDITEDNSVDKSNQKNDLNLLIGTGVELHFYREYSLMIGGRYSLGTTTITNYTAIGGSWGSVDYSNYYKSRRLSIEIGVTMPLQAIIGS